MHQLVAQGAASPSEMQWTQHLLEGNNQEDQGPLTSEKTHRPQSSPPAPLTVSWPFALVAKAVRINAHTLPQPPRSLQLALLVCA